MHKTCLEHVEKEKCFYDQPNTTYLKILYSCQLLFTTMFSNSLGYNECLTFKILICTIMVHSTTNRMAYVKPFKDHASKKTLKHHHQPIVPNKEKQRIIRTTMRNAEKNPVELHCNGKG